jgi:hypothetical protein
VDWVGYDDETNNGILIAPYALLDLSDDISSMNLPWVPTTPNISGSEMYRAPNMEPISNGGTFGNGTMRFSPGSYTVTDNCGLGQHYAGIGQIGNL